MQVHPKTRFNLFQLDTISAQVMRVCQIGLLISLLLTLPLWLPFMTVFPQIPLFEALPEVPTSIQIYLFGIAVFSLLLGFFAPTQKWGLLSFMVCISASVFVDFLRIQPWLYYFTLFMGIILLAGKDEDKAHSLIAFALSCVYIFSGLQKFNAAFAADTYPWLIAPITQFLPDGLTNVLNKTWLLAPVTEWGSGSPKLEA